MFPKPLRPIFVVLHPSIVRLPIKFNNQLDLSAVEVGDERPNRYLPAELESAELPISQGRPEFALGKGGIHPHVTGALGELGIDAVQTKGRILIFRRCHPHPNPLPGRERGAGSSRFVWKETADAT